MANTIRAAKNTFGGGLVMDLSPDTTPNEVLTSALNATLVTFNGNELLLQNDMGNGRVETARLPEGYIPVGTCEFGDIIYIVSYNPLTNKSLIGCFPSPERNISSEEIGSNGQQLSASDFLELAKDENDLMKPTGRLVASSVKKIIYNNTMNPGDKYIIYDSLTKDSSLNYKYVTDYGNTQHVYGNFPRLLRVHVIAIEDSGKINFLDLTVRWYDNNYFMMPVVGQLGEKGTPDIDSYRNLLSSGYSIFQSKISGKLALLIELEKVNGFSCTYNVYTSKNESVLDDFNYKKCRVYWNINWNTENVNVNPAYIVLTKSKWVNKDLDTTGGTWFSWEYDGSTNSVIPRHPNNIGDPPIAFGEGEYWYANISRQYIPTNTISYLDFIETESYEKKLENFITTIRAGENNPYANVELIKLNVARLDSTDFVGLPLEDKYYINLASIKKAPLENTTLENTILENTTLDYIAYTEDLTSADMYTKINPVVISDDIVNNYFNTSITKYFGEFSIPVKQTLNGKEYTPNITNLIYNYEIAPAMDYGILQEYAVEGYIDFSKIGTGAIDLTYWKYYNTENSSTLSLGLDAYVEENKGIAEVVLEFYDNQGKAAAYHIRNKESYSGTFTEFIPLNGATLSINLTSIDADNNPIYHLGTPTTKLAENVVYRDADHNKACRLYFKDGEAYEDPEFDVNSKHTDTSDLYINDAGVLYSNVLYLVKIIIKYCHKDALGNLDTSITDEFRTYYRWFWSNTLYNQYYANVSDFDTLPFTLNLDINTVYNSSDGYYYETANYVSPQLKQPTTGSSDLYLNSGSTVQLVSSSVSNGPKHNTQYYLLAGLYNNYNTFGLRGDAEQNTGLYPALTIDIFTDCDQYVENVLADPDIVHGGKSSFGEWTGVKPILPETFNKTSVGPTLKSVLNNTKFPSDFYNSEDTLDMWENINAYKNYANTFNVTDFETNDAQEYQGSEQYIAYNNTAKPLAGKKYVTKTLHDIYDINHAGTFTANIIHFSRYYYINKKVPETAPCLVPILREIEDLDIYGLGIAHISGYPESDKIPYVLYLYAFEMWDDENGTESHLNVHRYNYSSAESGRTYIDTWYDDWDDSEDHGAFGGHDGLFWRDKSDWWQSFKHSGFFLHGLYMHYDSSYGGSVDYNVDNNKDRLWRKTIGDNWNTLYGGVGPQDYCVSRYRFSLHGLEEWSYGWEAGGYHIAGVGYNGDEKGWEHLFNTYFMVNGDPQRICFAQPYADKLPKYIGQYLATILCGIYLYKSDESQEVLKTNDIIHLEDNYTTYIKDIVYKATIPSEYSSPGDLGHNGLLLLQGIQFTDYINTVKNNANAAGLVNDTNVTLTLKGCIKNNPIQYKLDYIAPNYDDLAIEGVATAMVIKADGSTVPATSRNFEKDKLYWLDDNGVVLPLNRQFSAECVETMDDSTGHLVAKYNPSWGRMKFPKVYQMFKWVGDKLVCAYTDTAPSNADRYAMHGQEEADFAIHDYRKDEVLVPIGNLMKPTEIPLPL